MSELSGAKSVIVIGAGAAGLTALRHLTDPQYEVSLDIYAFEQTGDIGGTWVYRDQVGCDEYGLPVHSSMYKSLRTNLPKEVMQFPDFPIAPAPVSYLPAHNILEYLQDYAREYDLLKYIKFHHHVMRVTREKLQWKVEVKDLKSDQVHILISDVVMICNGHYNTPSIPQLKGMDYFKGSCIHSHDYREPNDKFQDKVVLVIGAGPSGIDLAVEIARVAKMVYLSHHSKEPISSRFPSNFSMKPDILRILENGKILFKDGSEEQVDTFFYCTGYMYHFPFLDSSCKISTTDNRVYPLYKHMINIEYPTMCFLGLPYYVCTFAMFNLQAQYYLKLLGGQVQVPNKVNMLEDTEQEIFRRQASGLGPRQFHKMGPMQSAYYDELADLAQVAKLPPVLSRLHNESSRRFMEDIMNYRDEVYEIQDEETYRKIK